MAPRFSWVRGRGHPIILLLFSFVSWAPRQTLGLCRLRKMIYDKSKERKKESDYPPGAPPTVPSGTPDPQGGTTSFPSFGPTRCDVTGGWDCGPSKSEREAHSHTPDHQPCVGPEEKGSGVSSFLITPQPVQPFPLRGGAWGGLTKEEKGPTLLLPQS